MTEALAVYRSDGVLLRLVIPDIPDELDDPAHSDGGIPIRFTYQEPFRLCDAIAIAHIAARRSGIEHPRTQT